MKFISFFCINFFLLTNTLIAETFFNKSEILNKSEQCFLELQKEVCEKLILQMEEMQLFAFERNKFKCQSSILGLQTEIIEAYYFKKINKSRLINMLPLVIKNC